jgi:hypothetical protein
MLMRKMIFAPSFLTTVSRRWRRVLCPLCLLIAAAFTFDNSTADAQWSMIKTFPEQVECVYFLDQVGAPPTVPSVSCSDGVDRAKPKQGKSHILSFDTASCDATFSMGKSLIVDGLYHDAYDTLKYYIEQCYSDPFSSEAFNYISSAFDGDTTGGSASIPAYRDWLFSVLYLNRDTNYYCADVGALMPTFGYIDGPTSQEGIQGEIAVEKFIIASGKCYAWSQEAKSSLKSQYHRWYEAWKDTVHDSLLTPWDTTLPTLQQIGFGILLGPDYVAPNGVLPSSVLGEIGVSPNPFVDYTVIDYTLNVPATLAVDVYDLLGHRVTSPVPSLWTNNGAYSFTLSGSTIAAGTYYVRFSVPEGEVRTVKVIKE